MPVSPHYALSGVWLERQWSLVAKQKIREILLALHRDSRFPHAISVRAAVVRVFDILVKSS